MHLPLFNKNPVLQEVHNEGAQRQVKQGELQAIHFAGVSDPSI